MCDGLDVFSQALHFSDLSILLFYQKYDGIFIEIADQKILRLRSCFFVGKPDDAYISAVTAGK